MMIYSKQWTQCLKIFSCLHWESLMQGQDLVVQNWRKSIGRCKGSHIVGKMNDSGAVSLSFCTLNYLVTYFEKCDMYKCTQQHPGRKLWHCIDYSFMRQCQRNFCHVVSVLHKADCWTHHKLVRAKLFLTGNCHVLQQPIRRQFAPYKSCDDNNCCAFMDAAVIKVICMGGERTSLLARCGLF